MKTLGFPDQHHLNAALGWLELGNPGEAKAEVEKLSLLGRVNQEAFLVRWRIAGRVGDWEEGLRLAQIFTKYCAARPAGWICLSYSLYRLRRPLEAWMQLLPKASEFPKVSAIHYMLACYAWELGNQRLAKKFLERSSSLGGPAEIHGSALGHDTVESLTLEAPVRPEDAAPTSAPPGKTGGRLTL